jgi:hypothetical protein
VIGDVAGVRAPGAEVGELHDQRRIPQLAADLVLVRLPHHQLADRDVALCSLGVDLATDDLAGRQLHQIGVAISR